jgi:protein phosphatase
MSDMDTLIPQFACITDKGKVRDNNEDNVIVDEELGLAAVADGMGGHNAGELASSLAVKTLREALISLKSGAMEVKNPDTRLSAAANLIHFAAHEANDTIYSTSIKQTESRGMGTTLSAVLVEGNAAAIAHIGDSRIYLLREDNMTQLTNDHSLVMEQVRKGIMTREEAETSTMQNILTRAMGISKSIKIDAGELSVIDGDILLICSDGLFKAVKEMPIQKVLASETTIAQMCVQLVNMALENGGPDNVTVAIIKFRSPTIFEKIGRLFRSLTGKSSSPSAKNN